MAVRSRIKNSDPRLGALVAYYGSRQRGVRPVLWAEVTEVLETPGEDYLTVRCRSTGVYAVLCPPQVLVTLPGVRAYREEAIALVAEPARATMGG